MSRRKPVVGETLFSVNTGNACNQFRPQTITPVIVHSVGRKYFFAGPNSNYTVRYHVDSWSQKTEYMATSKLYETEQAYEDDKEANQLERKIKDDFGSFITMNLPLTALRTIDRIIENNRGDK